MPMAMTKLGLEFPVYCAFYYSTRLQTQKKEKKEEKKSGKISYLVSERIILNIKIGGFQVNQILMI